MKCRDLVSVLEKQSPKKYACDWDNVGLLVGDLEQDISRVYIALDATDEAIDEAIQKKADLLLTHHPMIFKGIRHVTMDDFIGRRIIRMIRGELCYYAMHTNFDVKGMANLAAGRLRLLDARPLEVTCIEDGISQGIGRFGKLEKQMSLQDFVEQVKAAFDIPMVKVFGDPKSMVQSVAVCPGSGKSNVKEALETGAEVYLTGDIDHHTGIDANAQGMAIVDAGHYGLEHIFVDYMKEYLHSRVPEISIETQKAKGPFTII